MADAKAVWRLQLPRFNEPPFRPYATGIGQATLAWNELHEHLGRLFALLLPTKNRAQPFAIWQSSRIDRAKREMLAAAALAIRDKLEARHPAAFEDIDWLLKRTTEVEDARNNAVHVPLQLVLPLEVAGKKASRTEFRKLGKVEPLDMGGNQRAIRMSKKDLLGEILWCRDAATTLRDFTLFIDHAIDEGKPPSWPDRPPMPVRRALKKQKAQPRSKLQ